MNSESEDRTYTENEGSAGEGPAMSQWRKVLEVRRKIKGIPPPMQKQL